MGKRKSGSGVGDPEVGLISSLGAESPHRFLDILVIWWSLKPKFIVSTGFQCLCAYTLWSAGGSVANVLLVSEGLPAFPTRV